jgi:hypothetical protein
MEQFLKDLKNFISLMYLMFFLWEWDGWKPVGFDPVKDTMDLDGKVAIVTGGKSGSQCLLDDESPL